MALDNNNNNKNPFEYSQLKISANSPQHNHARRRALLSLCLLLTVLQMLLWHRNFLTQLGPSSGTTTIRPAANMLSHHHEFIIEDKAQNSSSAANSSTIISTKIGPTWPDVLAQQQRRRLPDALIIGVRKGGTRALLDALALHSRVRVARHEVHFFDCAQHFRRGLQWYRAQMPEAGPADIVLEKTPAYFTNPAVPKRVYALNPSMKLVLIVREPVVRTISDFTQIRQTKLDRHKVPLDFQQMSFSAALSNGTTTTTVELNRRFKPIRNSLYADHFAQWAKYFPVKQFLVVDGDKFIKEPLGQLRLLEQFLGIGAELGPDQLVYNAAKGFFCFRRERHAPTHCLGQSKGRKQQVPVTDQFRRTLGKHFAPHNRRFFAQLNRHFPRWEDN